MKTPLDQLIEEAKAEDAKPRLSDSSWSAMEARLSEEIKAAPTSFVREEPSRFGRYAQLGVAVLAVAAATALVMKKPAANKPETILPDLGAGALSATEGAGDVRVAGHLVTPGQVLHAGDVVEAQGARAFLERPQKVTWMIDGAPPPDAAGAARARVTTTGDSVVLSLEDGAVEAQVAPVPNGEPFAIDIPTDHTNVRVAVHGTHLRVARVGSLVTVDLTEGVVAIREQSKPAASTTVNAPSHVEFDAASLESTLKVNPSPVREAVALPPAPVPTTLKVTRLEPAPHRNVDAPAPLTPKPRATVATTAPAPQVAAPLPPREAIASAVRACAASRPRDEQVRVSVSSSLRLKIGPKGEVQAAQFDPPLQPQIQTCAAAAIYKLEVTGSEGTSITVPIDFTY